MSNWFEAARSALDSVSSTYFFPVNFTDSDDSLFESPLPVEEQIDAYPTSLQSISKILSPQFDNFTYTSHELPLSSFQLCVQSSEESPEKGYQSLIMNEPILSSTSSMPINQTPGLILPSRSPSLYSYLQPSLETESPEKLQESLTIYLSSPSPCNRNRSPLLSPLKTLSRKETLSRERNINSLVDLIDKVIHSRFDAFKSLKLIISNRCLKESKAFYFNFVKDGKILNANKLMDEMRKNMVKCPDAKIACYLKCICYYCQRKGDNISGRSNSLFNHMLHRQRIRVSCVYCDKLFMTLQGCKSHVKKNHWNLGEKTNYKFTNADRKNQTF